MREKDIRFLSVCSGIEAASVAFNPLGWKAVAFCEIDKFPSAVLAHHYPDVPNLGDFTQIDTSVLGRVDILCGGTPCQSFSVAGARKGLSDDRGNLTLAFVDLAHELADENGLRNAIWENVPGVLSDKGNAFGCFLAGLVGADDPIIPCPRPPDWKSSRRWKWSRKERRHIPSWPSHGMVSGPRGRAAWAVKDGQFFGLAQRRKRVIVIADFGNGADPAAVLFEPESVPRDIAPSREAGEGVTHPIAPSLASSGRGVERTGDMRGQDPVVAVHAPEIARCVATREGSSQDYETTTMVVGAICKDSFSGGAGGRPEGAAAGHFLAVSVTGEVAHTLNAEGADASEDGTGRGTPIVAFSAKDYGGDAQFDLSPTLRAGGHSGSHANAGVMPAVTVAIRGREGGSTAELGGPISTALRASQGGGDKPHVLTSAVRRLTPVECERLMGFPEIKKSLYIEAWENNSSDHQKSYASAVIQSLKSQRSALNADAKELTPFAPIAVQRSNTPLPGQEKRAAINVQMNLERMAVEISSPEKSKWSVNVVEQQNSSLLPIQIGDFARLVAHIFTIQDLIARNGKVESQLNINRSFPPPNGSRYVVPHGQESGVSAKDAALFITEMDALMKSTTSEAGSIFLILEQTLQTSLSFVTNVISSCIPEEILSMNSFDLNIETSFGYTNIPWRGKPTAPDGPRYKALGNSWAVPLFAWLGKRIDDRINP